MKTNFLSIAPLLFALMISGCGGKDNNTNKTAANTEKSSLNQPIPIDTVKYIYAHVTDEKENHYFIYENGEYALGPYQDCRDFKNGLAAVKSKNKWGFIDGSGVYIIPAKYKEVGGFGDGLCPVLLNSKWAYIDKGDNMIIKGQFEKAGDFSEGLAPIGKCTYSGQLGEKETCKIGFINTKGNIVIEPTFAECHFGFKEGLAVVRRLNEKNMIYIDKKGQVVIDRINKTEYIHYAKPFEGGVAETGNHPWYKYIDKNGDSIPGHKHTFLQNNVLFKPEREDIKQFYDKDGNLSSNPAQWGYKEGDEWIIFPIFKTAWPFHTTY